MTRFRQKRQNNSHMFFSVKTAMALRISSLAPLVGITQSFRYQFISINTMEPRLETTL